MVRAIKLNLNYTLLSLTFMGKNTYSEKGSILYWLTATVNWKVPITKYRYLETTAQLIWGMLFGAVGFGYFLYGKKQRAIVPLTSGIVLLIFPYFITNTYILVTVGVGLITLPYFVRI